jgi:S-adenosyl-L-methionine hydrolase (adenosine-forming)
MLYSVAGSGFGTDDNTHMAVALFTDFGTSDPYVGQVKAVLDEQAPGTAVIDLLNEAPACNVRASAHLLAALASCVPQGTVFFAVVDPGVGSSRAAVVMEADGYRFVGPDNGLLSVVCARASHRRLFRIAWRPRRLSPSFHGRDLFAPVAARLATGRLRPDDLEPLPELAVNLGAQDLPELIYVDHYGNGITGLRAMGTPQDTVFEVNGHRLSHARVFSDVPGGQAFWYANSAGLVEIACNQGSAAALIGLAVGTAVRPAAV